VVPGQLTINLLLSTLERRYYKAIPSRDDSKQGAWGNSIKDGQAHEAYRIVVCGNNRIGGTDMLVNNMLLRRCQTHTEQQEHLQ